MKAIVFSEDKTTESVLKGMLARYGFTDIHFMPFAALETTQPRDLEQSIVLLDLDKNSYLHHVWQFSDRANIAFFGEADKDEAAKYYSSPVGFIFYLKKPFSEQNFNDTIYKLLSSDVLSQIDIEVQNPAPITEENKETLQDLIKKSIDIKEHITKLLTSSQSEMQKMFKAGKVDLKSYPLKKVLIIERDKTTSNTLTGYLKEMNVFEVLHKDCGLDAWQSLKNDHYDLVILDWSIEDIKGICLYNRIRGNSKSITLPLLVTINKKDDSERRLLRDDHFTRVIYRSAAKKEFKSSLISSIIDHHYAKSLTDQTLSLVEEAVMEQVSLKKLKPETQRFFQLTLGQVGESLIAQNRLDLAEKTFKLAWKAGDRSPSTATSLAKVYHCQKKHRKAAIIISRADMMAPMDLQKIFLKAEINLWLHKFDDALALFQQALMSDLKSTKARAGQDLVLQMKNTKGDPRGIGSMRMGSPLNMTAIYKARQGKHKEALIYYLAAYSLVHTNIDKSKILFNIGLCYKRAGLEEKALQAFQKSCDISDGSYDRPKRYLENQGEEEEADHLEDFLEEFEDEAISD